MKKLLFLGLFFAMGCASFDTMGSLDWIPIGPEFHATNPDQIEVISSRRDIKRAYGDLGLLRIYNVKPDRDNIRFGIEKGRKFIAKKGADAMLVGQYNSATDGAANQRVMLVISAFKYLDTMTPEDEQALRDFEVLGILNERTEN